MKEEDVRMKWRKGDRCVIYKTAVSDWKYLEGKEGVIVRIWDNGDRFPFMVRLADGMVAWCQIRPIRRTNKKTNPKPRSDNFIKIDFQHLSDGRVRILRVRNLLSDHELYHKYGPNVILLYNMENEVVVHKPESRMYHCRDKSLSIQYAYLPMDVPRRWFDRLIAYYKTAGENLCRVVREEKARGKEREVSVSTVKTITI